MYKIFIWFNRLVQYYNTENQNQSINRKWLEMKTKTDQLNQTK